MGRSVVVYGWNFRIIERVTSLGITRKRITSLLENKISAVTEEMTRPAAENEKSKNLIVHP